MSDLLIIVLLIVAAMVLFLLEILTPLFGALVALAIGALAWAVYIAWTGISPVAGWVLLIAAVLGSPVYLYFLVKWLPNTPLGRRLFLKNFKAGRGDGTPEADELIELVGKAGTAETTLRPSGAVRIHGRRVIAVAESGMIEKGATVKAVRTSGMNLVVRRSEGGPD